MMFLSAFHESISNVTKKKILKAHFFLCGISFIKITMLLVACIYDATLLNYAVGKIGNNALWGGVGKLGVILQYFTGLFVLAFYAVAIKIFLQNCKFRTQSIFYRKIVLCFYFLLNIYFTLHFISAGDNFFHWLPYWLIFTVTLPLFTVTFTVKSIPVVPRWLSISMIIVLMLQIGFIFAPLIFKPMRIENDFMDIPGQTQLDTGEWVDNTKFINQHNIGGILKYDPRINHGENPAPRPDTFVTIHPTKLFYDFLKTNQNEMHYRLVYYPENHRLAVKGEIPDKDHILLKSAFTNAQDRLAIDQLYLMSVQQKNFYEHRVYTSTEWDFIQKNQTELLDQARTAWFVYHHNYAFTPILAITLGGDLHHLTSMYGWYNALLFSKLLTWMGGVNYQNYFHLSFLFYPIYYAGFLFLILFIFKRAEYGVLAMLLAIAGLLAVGIESIRLWPGLNPLRHFLDVPAFLCFYLYARDRKLFWLLLSYILSFVALMCSKEFGLFLIESLSMTVVIRAIIEKNALPRALLALFFAIGGLLLFFMIPGKSPTYSYLLLGIGSPITPNSMLIWVLLIFGVLDYCAISFIKIKETLNYFWLSVLFYCQFLMVYSLWFSEPNHFFNIAAPLSLLFVSFIYLVQRYLKVKNERNILSIFFALALLVYVPTALAFYWNLHKYNRIFTTHKLYTWSFATAQLQSTMDPQLFIHAVKLIQKYAPENSIYIISRYDYLLPVLARKYSAMLYTDSLTNLVTTNDIHTLANFIIEKQPVYLFVDTDIARDFNNDVYIQNDPLGKLLHLNSYSSDRATSLAGIQQVYWEIKKYYRPIASSELITVYKKQTP